MRWLHGSIFMATVVMRRMEHKTARAICLLCLAMWFCLQALAVPHGVRAAFGMTPAASMSAHAPLLSAQASAEAPCAQHQADAPAAPEKSPTSSCQMQCALAASAALLPSPPSLPLMVPATHLSLSTLIWLGIVPEPAYRPPIA